MRCVRKNTSYKLKVAFNDPAVLVSSDVKVIFILILLVPLLRLILLVIVLSVLVFVSV